MKPLVVIVPNLSENNPYLKLLADSISDRFQVNMTKFPKGLSPFTKLYEKFPDMQVLHIHWITELIKRLNWSRSEILFRFKLWLMLTDLKKIQRKKVKIIWTIHNKYIHTPTDRVRELFIRKKFAQTVDHIILHSESALKEINRIYRMQIEPKSSVIFHGNYKGCYPKPSAPRKQIREKFKVEFNQIMVLYFGTIKPYKGIESVIDAFKLLKNPHPFLLFIAGKVPDKEYQSKIQEKINATQGIHCRFEFISEQDLSDLLFAADLIVIPFVESLTSGSVILTMTAGRALMLPENAKIFDCIPEQGVIYFNSVEDLSQKMQKMEIEKIVEMGKANKIKADSMNWEKVAELTYLTYQQ